MHVTRSNLGLGRWWEKIIVYKDYKSGGSAITERLHIDVKQDFTKKKKACYRSELAHKPAVLLVLFDRR